MNQRTTRRSVVDQKSSQESDCQIIKHPCKTCSRISHGFSWNGLRVLFVGFEKPKDKPPLVGLASPESGSEEPEGQPGRVFRWRTSSANGRKRPVEEFDGTAKHVRQ